MDFGHTDPILTLPLWIKMEIDCDNKNISYLGVDVYNVLDLLL